MNFALFSMKPIPLLRFRYKHNSNIGHYIAKNTLIVLYHFIFDSQRICIFLIFLTKDRKTLEQAIFLLIRSFHRFFLRKKRKSLLIIHRHEFAGYN